jgi:O-antigen/teichoic acid export membrane protein
VKRGEIAESVSRGAFYLSLERIAGLISGLVYFALLLRWLGPTKYGVMSIALSFTGIATMATGNFEVFLERYAAEYHARGWMGTLRRALRLSLALKLGLGLLAAIVLAAIAGPLGTQFNAPELDILLPWFGLLVAFDGLSTTGRATLFGLQRYKSLFAVAVTFHVAKVLLVAVLWWTRQGLLAFAIGLVAFSLAQGVALWVVSFWTLRHAKDEISGDERPPEALLYTILGYAAPLFGARAVFTAGQNAGKIILGKFFEASAVGYFSFAFQIIERFVELAHTVPMALLPSMTHLVARGERERLRDIFDQAFRLIQVAACVLSFIVFAFAREITLAVASPLFEPAVPIVRLMALVPMVRTAQQPLTMLFQALRRPGAVLWLAMLKFVVEFGSYVVFLPLFGVAGAAAANALGAAGAYAAAHDLLNDVFPDGAKERAYAALINPLWLGGALVLAWVGSDVVGGVAGVALRLALIPVAVIAIFALRQITRYDLYKLGTVPIRRGAIQRLRDQVVASADRFAALFERRRPA